ncbi:hypothetical protein FQN55_007155 [Onygenales sp. PD_40]|nr:hypothetical protein FQN55_007155 [Onygenales sp. PD_40]
MKLFLPFLAPLLSTLPLPTHALNTRCAAQSSLGDRPDCICIDHNECVSRWGGRAVQGAPGDWPCPWDGENVWGCMVGHPCVTHDSYCGWKSVCEGGGRYAGTVLPGGFIFF